MKLNKLTWSDFDQFEPWDAAWCAARVKQIEILKNLIKTNYEI